MGNAICQNQNKINKDWPITTKFSQNKCNKNSNSIFIEKKGVKFKCHTKGKSETELLNNNNRKNQIKSTKTIKEKRQPKIQLEEACKQ